MSTTISLTGNSSILEAQYYPPIIVGPNAKCGLISMHTTNSIPNVGAHNDKFYFGTKMYTIRTGAYELNELLDYISFCTESNIHITNLAIYKQSDQKFVIIDRNDSEDELRIIKELLGYIPNSSQIKIGENHNFTHEKLNINIFIPPGDYLAGDVNSYINSKVQERLFGMEETKKVKKMMKRSVVDKEQDISIAEFGDDDYEDDAEDEVLPIPEPMSLINSLDNIVIDQHKVDTPADGKTKSISSSPGPGPSPSPSPSPSLNPQLSHKINPNQGSISPISQKPIIFNINKHTGKIMLYSREDIDFNREFTIGPLLGFNKRILKANQWHISDNIVSISNINNIAVHCNIISGSYQNNSHVHIIHEFDMQAPTGYKIAEIPKNILYLKVTSDVVTSITVKITNQHGELIDLRGEQVSVRLHIINE